jgi:hypothetical protein
MESKAGTKKNSGEDTRRQVFPPEQIFSPEKVSQLPIGGDYLPSTLPPGSSPAFIFSP